MPEQLLLPIPEMDAGSIPAIPLDTDITCKECGDTCDFRDGREHEGSLYCPECCHCPECGSCYSREDGYEVDGTQYCGECVHSCEECNFTTLNSDELHTAYADSYRRNGDSSLLCKDCCWKCEDCNRHFHNSADNGGCNAAGETICQRCAENYTCCEDCSTTIHTDDSHFHESREVSLCSSCYDESDDDATLVHEYSHKPEPDFKRSPGQSSHASHLYLGWELECDRKRASDDTDEDITESGLAGSDTIYCKSDSSLKHGFEMVSHPGTWQYWQEFDWTFAPALARRGYRSYDTTTAGMHVHVNKAWLSDHDRYKLLLFFRSNHRLVFRLSRRRDLDALNAYAAIDHDRKAALLRKATKGDSERYRAINMKPRHTVEFRLFRGTLKPESIKRNLALVTMVCHFAKHTSPGRISDNDFLTYVMSHGADIIGEPMATDLGKWVAEAVNGPCAADEGH